MSFYESSRRATLLALEKIDERTLLELTHLTLPEIRALRQEIAQVLPVGNLPAFILGGLVKLKGRAVKADQIKRDLATLFQGLNIVPQGLYGAFVAGPATVLYAYQKLLQLAGKDLQAAFPEGTWQFYLQFGLREDAARHANETVGFNRAFPQADLVAAATAWMWASADLILDYDDLLATDWGERVNLRLLSQIATEAGRDEEPPFAHLSRDWNTRRPYARPADGSPYLAHRHALFRAFLHERLALLSRQDRQAFQERYQARVTAELHAYQDQMSLLAALRPDRYQEQREPIPVWLAHVGFIWGGRIYLMPLCRRDVRGHLLCYPALPAGADPVPLNAPPAQPDTRLTGPDGQPVVLSPGGQVWSEGGKRLLGRLRPPAPEKIKSWVAAIIQDPARPAMLPPPSLDVLLAESPRAQQDELRRILPEATQAEIARLRLAPVILNWDPHDAEAPLPYIRRGQRGVGDHALTILRTGRGFVFDQSHIFFDGLWGMAVAERVTSEAIYRYPQVADLAPHPLDSAPPPLKLEATPQARQLIQAARHPSEAAAEDDGIETRRLSRLRRWLAQRGVRLTVNDLLLLYRYLHAGAYQPSRQARQTIEAFRVYATGGAKQAAVKAIDDCLAQIKIANPALLIPMDASNVAPRERVFPTTFRNPLVEVSAKIAAAEQALQTFGETPNRATWAAFDHTRREMLAYLQAFGQVLDALKAVTMRGESFNTATIRLLAHLPASMQNLLDQIPQHIGVLNEIIKGSEVFSNVGRVASGSSLSRFSSARDDGHTKWLVWGVLTDDQGVMRITLRDFRPFVPLLLRLENPAGRELADLLARDYLHGYVQGFNRFVVKLGAIVSEQKPTG